MLILVKIALSSITCTLSYYNRRILVLVISYLYSSTYVAAYMQHNVARLFTTITLDCSWNRKVGKRKQWISIFYLFIYINHIKLLYFLYDMFLYDFIFSCSFIYT